MPLFRDVVAAIGVGFERHVGIYLLGQAFFSRELIKDRFAPRSVSTVALCALDDAVLRPIAERFDIGIVVDEPPRSCVP